MRKIILSISFILLPIAVWAQSNEERSDAVITGKIVDETETPLAGASVAVQNASMSEIINGASSGQNGNYEIQVSPGSYVIEITFLSYQSYTQDIELDADEEFDMGTITLDPTTKSMDEITVRAEKSSMTMNFDKRVFQVGQDLTSLGGSALNVLSNVPSISLDIDGNVSLRGNEGVRVLINGRESSLVSNGTDALRSIPATLIQEVEIITNPSSKFAAEGSGGIINIILKKNSQLGFNGSAGIGSSWPQEHEISTNLNYRTTKVNWFFGGSIDYENEPEAGSSFQRFAGPDTTYMYRENTDATEQELDGNIRLGADFYLGDTQVLTASTYIDMEQKNNIEDVTYTDLQYAQGAFDGEVMQQSLRNNDEDGSERDVDFNLEYENKINGDDHKLTADASFDISRENSTTDIRETVQQGTGEPLVQRTDDGEEETDFRVDVEYERPLGDAGKLEAGLRTDTEWGDNSYSAEERQNGVFVPLSTFNDNFLYRENVNAAYLILGQEWGGFSGQFGLRAENTNIRTELVSSGDTNNQNYYNLFPSLFLNYAFSEKQSVQLSYSRRLSRPRSRSLIPFSDFSDSRSQYFGNPDLRPEFSNSYEAGYLRSWGTGSLLTSVYYRYRTDVTERITQQEEGVLRRFPINLATEEAWGVEFSADQDLFNTISITANANFFRSNSDGSYQEQIFSSKAESFQSRMQFRWDITDSWKYQASMRYRGPRETTQGQRAGQTMMDTGLSRELMDGKALLSLSVRDVFDSQNYNNTVTTDGNPNTDFFSQREFSWSTRVFSFNLRYYFGRGGSGGGR
jgi:outer membrane receptor protein involved in Fe transport